jgi:DNA-directed RNA polymerase subunit H (RpoH/RPB5)
MANKKQRLYDIKIVQLQLVADRGYNLGAEERLFGFSVDEFYRFYDEKATREAKNTGHKSIWTSLSSMYQSDDGRTLLAFYGTKTESAKKKIPINVVTAFADNAKDCNEALLIVDYPLSSKCNDVFKGLKTVRYQVFFDDELTFNPTLHIEVPKHELLTPEEANTILTGMKVTATQVPIIKVSDPIVRYYNWPVGGLVRIYRNDEDLNILAPKSIFYRIIYDK